MLPWCLRYCGADYVGMWVVKHLANDWLAGTWFFLVANAIGCFISFVMLFEACGSGNDETVFIWLSGSVEAFLFLIGSLYFVAGSYPHASQFYYAAGRNATGQTFEDSQGATKSQIDLEKKQTTHVAAMDLGIGKRGSALVAQRMEGRLARPTLNPLHRAPTKAGGTGKLGGYSPSASPQTSSTDLLTLGGGAVNPIHMALPAEEEDDEDDDEGYEDSDDDEEKGTVPKK